MSGFVLLCVSAMLTILLLLLPSSTVFALGLRSGLPSTSFWAMATDALPPQDAAALAEDLGIETDTDEHARLEKGPLCQLGGAKAILGKRKR